MLSFTTGYGNGYILASDSYTLYITTGTYVSVTVPTFYSDSTTLTYNGQDQALGTGYCTTGGTMYYYITTGSSGPSSFSTSTWSTSFSAKNAGTYNVWWYCYVSDTTNYYGDTSGNTRINTITRVIYPSLSKTINKATPTFTKTDGSSTYPTTAYGKVTAGVAGTVYYGTTTSSMTSTTSASANTAVSIVSRSTAGTSTVYAIFTPNDTANYNSVGTSSSGYLTVKAVVAKATGSVSVTTTNRTYTGLAQVLASCSSSTGTYYLGFGSSSTSAPSSWTNGSISKTYTGTYYVWKKCDASTNYNDVSQTYVGSVTISRATTASASASNKTYNGSSQKGVTGSYVSWSGVTAATDACSYTAYATPDSDHAWSDGTTSTKTITWTMSSKSISGSDITVTLSASSYTYSGSPQGPTVTVKDTTLGTTLISGTDYTVLGNSNTSAGTYTVTVTGKGNYGGTNKSKSYTISSKPISIPTPTSTENPYDGSTTRYVSFGSCTGASITNYRFSTDNSTWTEKTSNPGRISVGTYYVQAYYTASTNYTGSGWSSSGTVKVTAPTVTVTLDMNGGSSGTSSVSITYGTTVGNYPSITLPSRNGYTFAGYYDSSSGGTQYYNSAGNSVRTWDKTSATTLYAHWTVNYITLSVSGVTAYTLTLTDGGYGGTIPSYTSTATTTSQSLSVPYGTKYTCTWTSGTDTGTGSWTITWDGQSGTPSPSTSSISTSRTRSATQPNVTSATAITSATSLSNAWGSWGSWVSKTVGTLATATRARYTLEGWYTGTGGSGTKITTSTTVNASVTYYANWTANKVTIPTAKSTTSSVNLRYMGSSQTGVNNYNSSYMTYTGNISGTNAGSYSATFTIGSNYMWSDGTTTDKTVSWYIGQTTQPMTISPTLKTIYGGASTDSTYISTYSKFTITPSNNQGSVTYASSNTNVATVSTSGVVTYVAAGSCTITVTAAGNSNYSSGSKTCSVTCTADSVSSTVTDSITVYGTPSVSIGSGITAAGGSATVTCSVTNTRGYHYVWKSGYTESNNYRTKDEAGTARWRITSNGNSRFSHPSSGGSTLTVSGSSVTVYNTGTDVSHSSMTTNATTDSVTVTAYNIGDTSKSKTAATSVTNTLLNQHYKNTSGTTGDNWTYGTPSTPTVTNNTNVNWCSGGSGTLSSSVTNTKTYYRKYDSGSYTTLYTETPSGSVTFVKTSDTGNWFDGQGTNWTLSGSTISHRDMTTSWVTDYCTIVAKNSSDTSKVSGELKLTASNTRTEVNITYYASCSIGSGLTAAGGSATVTYSGYHTANYKYASGDTDSSLHTTTGDGASITITTQTFTQSGGSASTITRFSLSGSTLSHTSMGKNTGSDYVKITATNSNSSSATATADKTTTNGFSISNPSLGATSINYGSTTTVSATVTWDSGSSTTLTDKSYFSANPTGIVEITS